MDARRRGSLRTRAAAAVGSLAATDGEQKTRWCRATLGRRSQCARTTRGDEAGRRRGGSRPCLAQREGGAASGRPSFHVAPRMPWQHSAPPPSFMRVLRPLICVVVVVVAAAVVVLVVVVGGVVVVVVVDDDIVMLRSR